MKHDTDNIIGLINTKYQYYLLGIPYSTFLIYWFGLINHFYARNSKWGNKFSLKVGGLLVLVIMMNLFLGEIIGLNDIAFFSGDILFARDTPKLGIIPYTSYLFLTPISVYAIKLQEKEFCFEKKENSK
ncbi:hypothetical protein [Natronospora cellulosivora (SeqCode)]